MLSALFTEGKSYQKLLQSLNMKCHSIPQMPGYIVNKMG